MGSRRWAAGHVGTHAWCSAGEQTQSIQIQAWDQVGLELEGDDENIPVNTCTHLELCACTSRPETHFLFTLKYIIYKAGRTKQKVGHFIGQVNPINFYLRVYRHYGSVASEYIHTYIHTCTACRCVKRHRANTPHIRGM